MVGLFFSAIALGLGFAAPPGPVLVEAARRGVAGGFSRAFMVGLGSLLGDSVWAVVALTGAAFVVENDAGRLAVGAAGVLWLGFLAGRALRLARSGELAPARAQLAARSDFVVGAVAALANPYVAGFWLAVGGGVTVSLVRKGHELGLAVFFAGFLVGCVAWCAFVSYLVGIASHRMTTRFVRAVNLCAGLVLAGFAALLLWRLVTG
jgi:L-lysine exporter family protein LysE/ArgO